MRSSDVAGAMAGVSLGRWRVSRGSAGRRFYPRSDTERLGAAGARAFACLERLTKPSSSTGKKNRPRKITAASRTLTGVPSQKSRPRPGGNSVLSVCSRFPSTLSCSQTALGGSHGLKPWPPLFQRKCHLPTPSLRLSSHGLRRRLDRRLLLGSHFLHPLHRLRMARPFNLLLGRRAVQLGMDIEAAQPGFLFLLDYQWIRLGEGILPHPGHLP